MQRTLDASAVVGCELADAARNVLDVLVGYLAVAEDHFLVGVTGFGLAS